MAEDIAEPLGDLLADGRRGSVSLGALKAVPISSRVPAESRNEAASAQHLGPAPP